MPTALLFGPAAEAGLGWKARVQAFAAALPGWQLLVLADADLVDHVDCVPLAPPRRGGSFRQIRLADAVMIAGGTVFDAPASPAGVRSLTQLRNLATLSAAAGMTRRPLAMVGVGAGHLPGSSARMLTRAAAGASDLFIVGDTESASTLSGAGVPEPMRVGADPSWALLEPSPVMNGDRPSRIRIIPSLGTLGGMEGAPRVQALCAAMLLLTSSGIAVELQQFGRFGRHVEDGALAADHLRHRLGSSLGAPFDVLPPPRSLPEAVDSLRDVGALLTSQFHALVAAGAAGVPAVAVGSTPTLHALARRLGQTYLDTDVSGEILALAGTAALIGPTPPRELVEREIAHAKESFRLLRVLLSSGQTEEADQIGALPLAPTPTIPQARRP